MCNPRIIPRDKGEREKGKTFSDGYYFPHVVYACCRAALTAQYSTGPGGSEVVFVLDVVD